MSEDPVPDEQPKGDAPGDVFGFGVCRGCRKYLNGRVLAEEGGASGAGLTVVVCVSCDTRHRPAG